MKDSAKIMRKLAQGKKLEWLAFALFAVLLAIVSALHEPWFDEAQVWQIAKCASLRELLFEIPHYEGHPAFWSLILAVPAKLGVPFEIGLKGIGFVISMASAYLLLFRTRLPRLPRIAIPFSYFFFYQYGVIVRPYGLMLLLMIALGIVMPERGEHPWRVFAVLALLCLTSAFGIVLACGVSVCIVWELWREKKTKRFFLELFRDARTRSLLVLLALALAIIAEILPRGNTYVQSAYAINSFWLCLLCALFTFPGECFLTFGSWFSIDRLLLQHAKIPPLELACFCVIGVVLWCVAICSSSRRSLKFLLVPYLLFAVFAAKVYFSTHHLGIVFMLFLFWAVLLSRDDGRFEIGRAVKNRISSNERDERLIKKGYLAIVSACLIVPLVWSVWASINEARCEYSYGRHASSSLSQFVADKRYIFCGWEDMVSTDPAEIPDGVQRYINTDMVGAPILINAYFDHNICGNLNGGRDNEAYLHYRIASYAECVEATELWRQKGIPDVIIARPDLSAVYGDAVSYADYTLVDILPMNYIWKTTVMYYRIPVYVRNDLLDEYGLEELESNLKYFTDGLEITEEMRERFENGEPIEEILKPYLDAMFGEEK